MTPNGNPIFIVGLARTGSKMTSDVLEASGQLRLLEELHLKAPLWIRSDVERRHRHLHTRNDSALDEVVQLQRRGSLPGSYWEPCAPQERATRTNVHGLSDERLREGLRDASLDAYTLMRIHLGLQQERLSAPLIGAKFPVEISYAQELFSHFPGAKVIHLVRDPRALLASMIGMDLKHRTSMLRRAPIGPLLRTQFLISRFRVAARVDEQLRHSSRYRKVRYEDLVLNPADTVAELCAFAGIVPTPEMLQPRVRNSSHRSSRGDRQSGFDPSSLEAWRTTLSASQVAVVSHTLPRAAAQLGYELP